MNKKEQVIQILTVLLQSKNTTYTKADVAKAIMKCRGLDPRTIKNWFDYLWKMEYLVQPAKGKYQLNYERIAELEIDAVVVNPSQRRLFSVG